MESEKVALIEVGCNRPELNEPIGIGSIAAYLQQAHSIPSKMINLYWQKISRCSINVRQASQFSLIGLSAQINSLARLESLYRELRINAPNTPIVIGNLLGIYASEQLLSLFPDAIICEGEGELPFAEMFEAVTKARVTLSSSVLSRIPGLAFRNGGKTVRTGARLADLSIIPPPRRDFAAELVRLGGIARIESSRGCHWGRCEFCSVASRFGLGGHRRFSAQRILEDLFQLARAGIRSPYFSDEDFFGQHYGESSKLARSICALKKDGKLPRNLSYFASVLAADVNNPAGREALRVWKSAGLREVFVGIEAGADNEIRRFSKKANAATNTSALGTLLAMGFQVDIGFIMFEPEMTLDDIKINIAWLKTQPLAEVDSRVTKCLRVQPRTGFESKYSHLITGPLLVDELSYPIRFQDERVQWIESEFRKWENKNKDAVYSMLASARGEIVSETIRLKLKRQLAMLRDLDIEYLSALVEAIDNGQDSGCLSVLAEELLARKAYILGSQSRLNE